METKTCPICDGAGKLEDETGDDVLSMRVCPQCKGEGEVRADAGPAIVQCGSCGGSFMAGQTTIFGGVRYCYACDPRTGE